MCHCGGAVVKELLARADEPGSTPGDAICFFLFGLCFLNTIFPFGLFSFILTAGPADYALVSTYILSSSPELYFRKGFRKLLICILGKLTARKTKQNKTKQTKKKT